MQVEDKMITTKRHGFSSTVLLVVLSWGVTFAAAVDTSATSPRGFLAVRTDTPESLDVWVDRVLVGKAPYLQEKNPGVYLVSILNPDTIEIIKRDSVAAMRGYGDIARRPSERASIRHNMARNNLLVQCQRVGRVYAGDTTVLVFSIGEELARMTDTKRKTESSRRLGILIGAVSLVLLVASPIFFVVTFAAQR